MNYSNVEYCKKDVIFLKKDLLELIEQLNESELEYLVTFIKELFFN